MTRIFFALAPHFAGKPDYEPRAREMATRFNFDAVFASDRPADADRTDWLADKLAQSQFAFFDFTGLDRAVLFAYAVASQIDVYSHPLIDEDERSKALRAKPNPFEAELLAKAHPFFGPDDFQRKAHAFLDAAVGAQAMHDQRLIARIKDEISRRHPVYMRQLASGLGKKMHEIQPVVYDLVRKGEVNKIGETSGSQYTPPN